MDASTEKHKRIVKVMYLLQALYPFWGITFVVAVVINYIYRPEIRATWLESHYQWSARTFWYGLLWSVIGGILTWVLIGWLLLFFNACWIIYRSLRGWLRLSQDRALYTG